MTPKQQLYKYFSDLMKPTGAHFKALIDSFWHKSEKIPIDSIEGLDKLVEGTASAQQLQNHINDTHAHKEVLDKKVDKVAGKKLTTEDFTTELRNKLEGLQQVDTSGLLPKGAYTGTAQDLKNLIDAINRILQSDDTDLDQLQEIVTYIKQNKHILSTLGISNIAGLVDALAAKAEKNHHHDERYAAKTHTHSEYAHRTHRHNWDDIDRKPNFNYLPLTGGAINPNKVEQHQEGIRINRASNGWAVIHIGGESGSIKGIKEGEFAIIRSNEGKLIIRTMKDTSLIEALIINTVKAAFGITVTAPLFEANNKIQVGEDGAEATLSNLGLILKNRIRFNAWSGGDGGDISCKGTLQIGSNSGVIHFRKSSQTMSGWDLLPTIIFDLNNGVITANKFVKQGSTGNHILMGDGSHQHIKILGRCAEINSDWTVGENWYGQTINIKKQLNVNLVPLENNYNISFRKCFNGGVVTFTTTGKTVVFTGDNKFNGGDGSTCVVSAAADKLYIDIRNI